MFLGLRFRVLSLYIACLTWLTLCAPTCAQHTALRLIARGDSLLLCLPKATLGRDFLLASRITALSQPHDGARGGVSAGQRLHAPVVVHWEQMADSAMRLVPQLKRLKNLQRQGKAKSWPALPIVYQDSANVVVLLNAFMQATLAQVDAIDHTNRAGRVVDSTSRCVAWHQGDNYIEVLVTSSLVNERDTHQITNRKSLRLLSAQPAPILREDKRVGYHTTAGRVHRYHLVPSDTAAYARGERVVPTHPIVFYVDTLFSPLWQDAIKAGIEDWQGAFETVGFKQAIVAKSYAEAGATFDADAIGVNTFRYIASQFPNAMGQHWVDPRSGEILEGEVLFYGNVLAALQRWYVLQTGGYNPVALQTPLPDSVLHRLIRYAAAHEIGHCLGLEHNNRASFAYAVDSLRSPQFTATHGTTASIMDYARFNYLAQPGDNVTAVYPPLLGAYDRYAIGLSHRYTATPDTAIRSRIDAAQEHPTLRFARQMPSAYISDYSCLTTDLGNDPLRALPLALANVQRLAVRVKNTDYLSRQTLVTAADIVGAYFDHLGNALAQVGGVVYAGTPYEQQATAKTSARALRQLLRYALSKRKAWQVVRSLDTTAYDTRLKKLIERLHAPAFRKHIEQQAVLTGYTWQQVTRAIQKASKKGLPQWQNYGIAPQPDQAHRKKQGKR